MRRCSMTGSKAQPFKHRSRDAIVLDILEYCIEPTLQTHIMYKANLSYATLKTYIDMLLQSGLLKVESSRKSTTKSFITTEKGREFIEHTRVVENLLSTQK